MDEKLNNFDKTIEELRNADNPFVQIISNIDLTNGYEVSKAIALFMNHDIGGAVFNDTQTVYFKEKEVDGVKYQCVQCNGKNYIEGYAEIPSEWWYDEIRPLVNAMLNAAEVYGLKISQYYMDVNGEWHLPMESNRDFISKAPII